MTRRSLIKAVTEARKFIRAANEADKEMYRYEYYIGGTKKTAALRRQSMDLTRALAEMRKP